MIKATILFADNDSTFMASRKERLEQDGFRVITADSPARAWGVLRQNKVDLAILDVRLTDDTDEHDQSGLKLAKEVTANQVPVIILSNHVDSHIKEILQIVGELSPLKMDIVGKQEAYEALALSIARILAIKRLKRNQH